MLKFDYKGIRIDAVYEMEQRTYRDHEDRKKTRFERNVRVDVQFWNFFIRDGKLHELAFVKSTLQYFMQAYWKRSSKEGSKIDLAKALHRNEFLMVPQSLYFTARQKDKQHYLHICLQQDGDVVNESYLDGQEVIMLDIAIGKAISLLAPINVDRVETVF
jgi:hypothetical protein